MKICAVITEYNPFHNGHLKQIEYIRENLPDTAIVAVMSGNIVQRGELAVLDKYTRAEVAVKCGVDAVVELPYPWCGGSAGYFARGAVEIAKKIGADYLCFGSESGDIEELRACADRTGSKEYTDLLDKLTRQEQDTPYIALARKAYRELYSCDIPGGANNTLAIEYLKNIGDITPLTYKRSYPSSATKARGFYRSGDMSSLGDTVPEAVYGVYKDNTPTSNEALASVVLWHLRHCDAKGADIDTGIASRMRSAANDSTTLADFYEKCATKKYTNSRLRRAVLNSVLGTSKEMLEALPEYTLLLAANEKGCKAVKQIKKRGDIILITKPADHCQAREQFLFSYEADKLFATARGERPCDIMKKKPVIIG